MKRLLSYVLFVCCAIIFTISISGDFVSAAHAERSFYTAPENLFQRQGLEDRINFWKGVFTKYGERQDIIHFREYPWIVYTVADYDKIGSTSGAFQLREFRKKNNQEEIAKIRRALTNLSEGKAPKDDLEKRIERLFSKLSNPKKQYKLALEDNQIRVQTGVRELFMDGVRRSGRYMYIIEDEMRKAGVPVELSRLPLVESSFNYEAYSKVGAAGIWQFMRGTGKMYNMTVNNTIDERRDPIESTKAAAKYLRNSYDQLGVWSIAITSYNHGLGGMQRAVKDTNSKSMAKIIKDYDGKTFGFASKNFYVSFIAALEVEKNYKHYFPELEKEEPLYIDTVKLNAPYRFNNLVKASGLNKTEFLRYNRAITASAAKGNSTIPSGYVMKVPEGKSATVLASLKGTPNAKADSKKTTVVAKSDKAKTGATKVASKSNTAVKGKSKTVTYTVKKGDTIESIARKFSTSQKKIIVSNSIKDPTKLRAGQTIKVVTDA